MRRLLTFAALAATTTLWSAACRSRADQAAAADVKASWTSPTAGSEACVSGPVGLRAALP